MAWPIDAPVPGSEFSLPHLLAATECKRRLNERNGLVERADARTRTGDPFITRNEISRLLVQESEG